MNKKKILFGVITAFLMGISTYLCADHQTKCKSSEDGISLSKVEVQYTFNSYLMLATLDGDVPLPTGGIVTCFYGDENLNNGLYEDDYANAFPNSAMLIKTINPNHAYQAPRWKHLLGWTLKSSEGNNAIFECQPDSLTGSQLANACKIGSSNGSIIHFYDRICSIISNTTGADGSLVDFCQNSYQNENFSNELAVYELGL